MIFDQIIFGLSIHAWITILTLIGIFVVMARSKVPVEVVFF